MDFTVFAIAFNLLELHRKRQRISFDKITDKGKTQTTVFTPYLLHKKEKLKQ
jgi:hypothetical protein